MKLKKVIEDIDSIGGRLRAIATLLKGRVVSNPSDEFIPSHFLDLIEYDAETLLEIVEEEKKITDIRE